MEAARGILKPGVTENSIAATIYATSLELGGEYPGSPPYVSVGARVCKPHASWTGLSGIAGDQVYIEFWLDTVPH